MNATDKIMFPRYTWWLLLLVPVTFFGFYPSYFKVIGTGIPEVFHLHAAFMMLWILLAITQPLLIAWKKTRVHRFIGKISYFIMPVVFVTGYMIIRHSYQGFIHRQESQVSQGTLTMTAEGITAAANDAIIIGIVYLAWLIIFYFLGVINRKSTGAHSTYMFAATLTLLGPTVDRILFQLYQAMGRGFDYFAELFVFVLIDILLVVLILYQKRRGRSPRPALTALVIYVLGQLGYFFLPKTALWDQVMSVIM